MHELRRFAERYLVRNGNGFRLADVDPADTADLESESKKEALDLVRQGITRLGELQEMLYAQNRWALLLIFQAMDAAGKDSTIKHVLSGVNPQGCQVFSFKAPSAEELDHDFLWRSSRALPERGRIGIFNRSYYEEVIVVRVHPELLQNQRLPVEVVSNEIWNQRYQDINAYENYLSRNGLIIRKFFLHVSKNEQKKRFLKRLEEPEKNWKFSPTDVRERQHWAKYMQAYEEMIRNTSTPHAPWCVVPADHKWFTRLIVAAEVVDALEDLNLRFPALDAAAKKQQAEAKRLLEQE